MNVVARMLQPHILLQESSWHIYIEVVNTRKVKTCLVKVGKGDGSNKGFEEK